MDPITIGALLASAAGGLISGNEANSNARRQQEARNAVTLAELARQKAYGDQARGQFDKSMALFGPGAQEASLAKAQGDIGSLITGNIPTAESIGTITTASAPRGVASSENDRLAGVFQRLGQNAINLGNLKGYGQSVFDTNLGLNQTGRDIDRIGDLSKTSARVAEIEKGAAATNAYKPPSGIGELLSFAGNAGLTLSGKGKLPGFSGLTTLPSPSNPTVIGSLY